MWVKICGNTNLEDAALAAELGADALGFIFAESKRRVTPAEVAVITPLLPSGVERVGVFYSHDPEEIAGVAQTAGLTAVQLHGGLDEDLLVRVDAVLGRGIRIIQTLHWAVGEQSEASAQKLAQQLEHVASLGITDRVLIDSKVGAAGGGTGVAFNWSKAREVFANPPAGLHLILAGGLNPDNVAKAIAELQPWGVDVSSGVEASPRRKSPERVAQFIENARVAAVP